MSDSRYARKWGVTKLPAIVYFRKRFPSIYRGEFITYQSSNNHLNDTRQFHFRRRFTQRRRGAGMVAQESIPPTRTEHIYVRTHRHFGCLCIVYGVFAAMFQTTSATARCASETTVEFSLPFYFLSFFLNLNCVFFSINLNFCERKKAKVFRISN